MDIAVKKILDNSDQLRLFISPRVSTLNQDITYDVNDMTKEAETQNYSFGLGADYLWTLIKHDDISLYGGAGLVVSYKKGYNKNLMTENDTVSTTNESINPSISTGLPGILGVEWKVSNKIGIHSEYLIAGNYLWDKSEVKVFYNGVLDNTSKSISSKITLNSYILFGLSIYF